MSCSPLGTRAQPRVWRRAGTQSGAAIGVCYVDESVAATSLRGPAVWTNRGREGPWLSHGGRYAERVL